MANFEDLKPRIEQRPCHICGSKEFEWGYMNSSYSTKKYSYDQHLMSVRCCKRCQNVQMFKDEQYTRQPFRLGWLIFIGMILLMIFFCVGEFIGPIISNLGQMR